jgi:hypothetical protein
LFTKPSSSTSPRFSIELIRTDTGDYVETVKTIDPNGLVDRIECPNCDQLLFKKEGENRILHCYGCRSEYALPLDASVSVSRRMRSPPYGGLQQR